MAVAPIKHAEYREVIYDNVHWDLLKVLRGKAIQVMKALDKFHLQSIVHGSVARGDVHRNSDIDVFVSEVQNSFLVETALENARIKANTRLIVQATPTYAMKAHIEIDENTSVSFPLMVMRKVEREFYKFGGEASLYQLESAVRVPGVDKRLMLVEPTKLGHVENSAIGREELVAKVLGISVDTVMDRVHALVKRDKVGRTGVFVKKELGQYETFELALKKLADGNPAVRRRMRKE